MSVSNEICEGGCACGAVRLTITGAPIAANHCHCRDCQRESGTGHGSYMAFLRSNMTIEGTPARWDMIADSGNVKTRNFCAACGLPLFLSFADMPDIVAVRAAILDDPSLFAPGFVSYANSALDWDPIDPTLPSFAKMPPLPA